MKEKNCSNCGAPISINKFKCPYCGTPYKTLYNFQNEYVVHPIKKVQAFDNKGNLMYELSK